MENSPKINYQRELEKIISEIIELLSKFRSLSISDLTKATNTSSTSISKYTGYLLKQGIIKSSYSNAKKGDVKSTRFNIHPSKYFTVYDLSDDIFKIHICALTGKIKKEYTYRPYTNKDFYENKHYFLKIVDQITSKNIKNYNCGSAVILSDNYDNNPILKTRMLSLIEELPQTKIVVINKESIFKASSIKDQLSSTDYVLCLFLNRDYFYSSYLTATTDINDSIFGRIGEIYKVKGIPLKDYVDYMETPEKVIEAFHNIIDNIITTIPINKVAITGNLYPHLKALKEILEKRFENQKLIFYYIDHNDYIPYIAKQLCKSMTQEIISTYLSK